MKMRATIVLLLLATAVLTVASENKFITCEDLKHIPLLGKFFVYISNNPTSDVLVQVYLSTTERPDPIRITPIDAVDFQTSRFNPYEKTFIIIHGFKSGGQKTWVLDMKDAILKTGKANVLMVDWSLGSNAKNYVRAAKNSQHASNQLFTFFQSLRNNVARIYPGIKEADYEWNHLYFIGHSLGAQVSGQTAHVMRKDKFWKIERITGLDPASPCFKDIDPSLRLDTHDADFVDIIHTQIGTGQSDALGLKDSIGHADFYVNGGLTQPECAGHWYTPVWDKMICSHKLAYKYFTESILNKCSFATQRWNGSYEDAQLRLSFVKEGLTCNDCPKMGFRASQTGARGTFIAITGTKEPHCELKDKDMNKVVEVIRKLKGVKSIFDLREPTNLYVDPNANRITDEDYDTRKEVRALVTSGGQNLHHWTNYLPVIMLYYILSFFSFE